MLYSTSSLLENNQRTMLAACFIFSCVLVSSSSKRDQYSSG
jgi:hypothetical protein